MTIFIHITAIIAITVSAYVTYGGWCKGFGEKHYEVTKRMFPWLVVWPKTLHVIFYKALTTSSLLAVVVIYMVSFGAFG